LYFGGNDAVLDYAIAAVSAEGVSSIEDTSKTPPPGLELWSIHCRSGPEAGAPLMLL